MSLKACSIVAGRSTPGCGTAFHAVRPDSGESIEPAYHSVGPAEVDAAVQAAYAAFQEFGSSPGKARGAFLRAIADRLDAIVDDFVARTPLETGLPEARVRAEAARTTGQLRLFAGMVEEGSWVDARIDSGDPARTPAPKPDVRSMLRPTGPVAVFGAANFPLAYSVAGGDTASALAAGCPVIVKAHPAHPGTSELAGLAVSEAVRECGLHEGVFSLLFDSGYEVGRALVAHPLVKAVGFTGSRAGGLALAKIAAARPEPIPVFAEMSSVNPVFILPSALAARASEIATSLHASVTLSLGQMCTCPGLVIALRSPDLERLIERLAARMTATQPGVMLNSGIEHAYREGLDRLSAKAGVRRLTSQDSGAAFTHDPALAAEVFGPSTLIVECNTREDMLKIARSLEGQLTATVHGEATEWAQHADLLHVLETRAGRLILNGVPTGVEVGPAIVHGGPYPATVDGRSTSVGTRSILRFVRPVCYQGFPNLLLPDELKEGNPLSIRRMVNGAIVEPR